MCKFCLVYRTIHSPDDSLLGRRLSFCLRSNGRSLQHSILAHRVLPPSPGTKIQHMESVRNDKDRRRMRVGLELWISDEDPRILRMTIAIRALLGSVRNV